MTQDWDATHKLWDNQQFQAGMNFDEQSQRDLASSQAVEADRQRDADANAQHWAAIDEAIRKSDNHFTGLLVGIPLSVAGGFALGALLPAAGEGVSLLAGSAGYNVSAQTATQFLGYAITGGFAVDGARNIYAGYQADDPMAILSGSLELAGAVLGVGMGLRDAFTSTAGPEVSTGPTSEEITSAVDPGTSTVQANEEIRALLQSGNYTAKIPKGTPPGEGSILTYGMPPASQGGYQFDITTNAPVLDSQTSAIDTWYAFKAGDTGDIGVVPNTTVDAASDMGLRQTGGGSGAQSADELYDSIRANDADVNQIAQNTGIKPENIQTVKDHVFYDEHLLDRYVDLGVPAEWGRFDSDMDMGNSWLRLTDGTYTDTDIQMLRHETAEAWYMRQNGPGYSAAHNAAQARFPSPFQ